MENQNDSAVILNSESSGLKSILAYGEDSDNEEVQQYREPKVYASSSSESDESDEEEVVLPIKKPPKKSKQEEILEPILDVSGITIKDTDEFLLIGKIAHFIGDIVTIQTILGTTPYNLDTVLFIDREKSKKPFGAISDVVGQVHNPLYVVRMKSLEDIKTMALKEGMDVYVAHNTEHTKFIFLSDLLKKRGTDASWVGDQELPSDLESSDEGSVKDENVPKKRKANRTFPHGFDPKVPPPNTFRQT